MQQTARDFEFPRGSYGRFRKMRRAENWVADRSAKNPDRSGFDRNHIVGPKSPVLTPRLKAIPHGLLELMENTKELLQNMFK